jgi:ribosome-associated translation inhibitor RaiA
MKIQLNTDKHIDSTQGLASHVEMTVSNALDRFADQITRVEVHLSDESGPKNVGDDKRCLIEARIAGRQPLIARHDAPSVHQAIDGAIERLVHAITSSLGKLDR